MAASRQPGPVCHATRPSHVNDGTSARFQSPHAGPVNSESTSTKADDYLQRVSYVKRAWDLMEDKYGPEAILKQTGADFSELVAGILPSLLAALGAVVFTTVVGAAIGGLIGALGGGVTAIPGAIAGGEAGFSFGMWILEWLGLGFLVVYVGSGLNEVGKHFTAGITRAWNSRGSRRLIDAASREMADAVGRMFSLILQGLVALFMEEGLESAVKIVSKSRLGESLAAFVRSKAFRRLVANTLKSVDRLEAWLPYIQRINLATAVNEGALWSKIGSKTAAELAANSKLRGIASQRKTLETILKEEKDFLDLYNEVFGKTENETTRAIWEALSRKYVRGLKGNVEVYVDHPRLLRSIQNGQLAAKFGPKPQMAAENIPGLLPVLTEELDVATDIMREGGSITSITFRDPQGKFITMLTREQIIAAR